MRLTSSIPIVLTALLTQSLVADVLILPNGERLSGTYLGTRDGIVEFETEHLGVVRGQEDVVEVELETETAFAAYIPPLLAFPSYEDDAETEEVSPPPEPGTLRAFTQSLLPDGWGGTANFAFSQVNTDSTIESLIFALQAERVSGDNVYLVAGAYDYGKQVSPEGVATTNIDRYSGRFRWTHNFTDIWSFQTRSIYLKDMLRDIDHSATQSLGLGYNFIDEENLEISLTPAVAGRYIDAQGFNQHWLGLATLYQSLVYRINGSLRLEQGGSAEYNPGQPVEYAYDFQSGVIASLTDWMEAGLIYQYNFDNIVGPDADKVEERILVQLGVPF